MKRLAGVGLIVLPIACCVGVPLLAAGVGVAVAAWIGGVALAGIVVFGTAVVIVGRLRHRASEPSAPFPTETSRG